MAKITGLMNQGSRQIFVLLEINNRLNVGQEL
jgi:hypothetical protein